MKFTVAADARGHGVRLTDREYEHDSVGWKSYDAAQGDAMGSARHGAALSTHATNEMTCCIVS